MFTKGEYWIFILLFFSEERQVLSRDKKSSRSGESSTPKKLDKLIGDESSSTSHSWFDFGANLFKKDYQLAHKGEEFMKNKKYDDAIKSFTKAINKRPQDPVPYFRLRGDCYRESRQLLKALDDYDRVIKLSKQSENEADRIVFSRLLFEVTRFKDAVKEMKLTKNAAEIASLGDDLMRVGQYDEAFDCFSESIHLNPNVADYYRKRASSLFTLRATPVDLMIKDLTQVVAREPNTNDLELWYQALLKAGKYTDAIEELLVSHNSDGLVQLGDFLVSKGKYNDALRCYDVAIKKNSTEAKYYEQRGLCYAQMQMCNEAIQDFNEMKRSDPDNQQYMAHLKTALFNYGKTNKSFEGIIEENLNLLSSPDFEDLGLKFYDHEKFDIAVRCFTEALNRSSSESAYRSRGVCYWKMKKFKQAITDICKALTMKPDSTLYRADLIQALSDYEEIDEVVEESIAILSTEDLEIVGNHFFTSGKLDSALWYSNEVLKRNPSKSAYVLRGKCYLEMKNFKAAISDLREALETTGNAANESEDYMKLLRRALYEFDSFDDVPEDTLNLLNENQLQILGSQFQIKNMSKEALRCYSTACAKNSPNPDSYKLRANFYLQINDKCKAAQDLLQVTKMNPGDKSNWTSVRRLLYEAGKLDELVEYSITFADIDEHIDLCDLLHHVQQFELALRCYTEAINKYPTDLRLYQRRGNVFLETQNFEMALNDFQQVVERDPKNEENWASFSELLFKSAKFEELIDYTLRLRGIDELETLCNKLRSAEKLDEAVRCYTYANRASPSDPEFYKRRANFYVELGEEDMAVFDLLTVCKIDRTANRGIWTRLVQILFDSGRVEELPKFIENAIPELTGHQLAELGDALSLKEKFEVAVHCYTEAILKNPNESTIYKSRGDGYVQMKYFDLAENDFIQALMLDPEYKESLASIHEILFQKEKYDELIHYTTFVSDLDELARLGDKFMAMDNMEKAFRCYNEGLMKYPFQALYHYKRGLCHQKMFYLENAIVDLKEAVALAANNVRYRVDLIDVFIQDKRFDEAETVLANAPHIPGMEEALLEASRQKLELMRLKEMPESSQDELINYTISTFGVDKLAELGNKFMAVENFEKAFRCYDEGLMKYPEVVVYHNKRGLCHWKMQNVESAISDLEKAAALEPMNFRYRVDLIDVLLDDKRFKEAETALANARQVRLTSEDDALLETILQKIETMSFKELINYLKELVSRDAAIQTNRIREKSPNYGLDNESFNKIIDVEFDRDSCLEELTREELKNFERIHRVKTQYNVSASMELPQYLQDPIMFELLRDPIVTPNGITYEREVILKILLDSKRDPVSYKGLDSDDLRPNLAIKEAVEFWKENH